MNAAGFGYIVRRLLLGEVGNVAGHGSRNNKGSAALLLEVRADSLCAVGSTIQVDLNDLVPSGRSSINDARIRRGTGTAIDIMISVCFTMDSRWKVQHTLQ